MGFFENATESFKLMRSDFLTLKQSMNDWIVYLNSSDRKLRNQVKELEGRVKWLELRQLQQDDRQNNDQNDRDNQQE